MLVTLTLTHILIKLIIVVLFIKYVAMKGLELVLDNMVEFIKRYISYEYQHSLAFIVYLVIILYCFAIGIDFKGLK